MFVIQKLSNAISGYLVREGACSSDDTEVAAFGLEVLMADSLQVFILLGISILFGILPPMFMFSLFYTLLRRCAGGIHAKSHFMCILTFSLTAFTCVQAGLRCPTEYVRPISVVLMIFTVAVIFVRAPVGHADAPRGPDAVVRFRRRSRVVALVEGAIVLLACLIISDSLAPYVLCSSLGGSAAAVTLLIPSHYAIIGDTKTVHMKGGDTDAEQQNKGTQKGD